MYLFWSGHLAKSKRDILGFLAHSGFNLLPVSPFRPQLHNYSCNTIRIAERVHHSISHKYYHCSLFSLPYLHHSSLISNTLHNPVTCGKTCGKQSCKICLQGEKALSRTTRRNLVVCQMELLQNQNQKYWYFGIYEIFLVHHILLTYTLYTHKL